jgi:hypothetical protein
MRFLLVFATLFLLTGCSLDQGVNRGYIISHSEVDEQLQTQISDD